MLLERQIIFNVNNRSKIRANIITKTLFHTFSFENDTFFYFLILQSKVSNQGREPMLSICAAKSGTDFLEKRKSVPLFDSPA